MQEAEPTAEPVVNGIDVTLNVVNGYKEDAPMIPPPAVPNDTMPQPPAITEDVASVTKVWGHNLFYHV